MVIEEYYRLLSDDELIASIRKSDGFAFEELHKRYQPIIYRWYNYISVNVDINFDDYFQEATICQLHAVRKYNKKSGASFGTYFSHCLYNKVRDEIRKKVTVKERIHNDALALNGMVSEKEDSQISYLTNLDHTLMPGYYVKRRYYMSELYNSLSSLELKVFQLYMARKTVEESAEILDASVAKVKAALGRCQRKFRIIIYQNKS